MGVDILNEYYGKVYSSPGSESLMFFGIHIGRNVELMSYLKLTWNYRVLRRPMCAGFLGFDGTGRYRAFQELKDKLGSCYDIDVVGCTAFKSMCSNIVSVSFRPPASWWVGIYEKGWLAIDLDYYSLHAYESLSDLLCVRNGMELYLFEDEEESV